MTDETYCERENCELRCPQTKRHRRSEQVLGMFRLSILILASIFFGFAIHPLHGQSGHSDAQVAVLSSQMAMVLTSNEDLSKKIDKLQNEVSSVEGIGAGVSGTIMILQVLGFVTRKRTDGGA